jgi:hypothetical protein
VLDHDLNLTVRYPARVAGLQSLSADLNKCPKIMPPSTCWIQSFAKFHRKKRAGLYNTYIILLDIDAFQSNISNKPQPENSTVHKRLCIVLGENF